MIRPAALPLLVLLLAAAPAVRPAAAQPSAPEAPMADVRGRLDALSPIARDEVIWLARCVLSESNREHEQRLVAWVVRNRVEAGYRGTTYREVVLSPYQFSAFNRASSRRSYLLSLNRNSRATSWEQALGVALDVYAAPASARPFRKDVHHFYSPISMKGRREPRWAPHGVPLDSRELGVDPRRFRFFAGIPIEKDPVPGSGRPSTAAAVPASSPAAEAGETTPSTVQTRQRVRARRTRLSGSVRRPARPSITRPSGRQ